MVLVAGKGCRPVCEAGMMLHLMWVQIPSSTQRMEPKLIVGESTGLKIQRARIVTGRLHKLNGGRSSIGRASDCGSEGCGFEARRSPNIGE